MGQMLQYLLDIYVLDMKLSKLSQPLDTDFLKKVVASTSFNLNHKQRVQSYLRHLNRDGQVARALVHHIPGTQVNVCLITC